MWRIPSRRYSLGRGKHRSIVNKNDCTGALVKTLIKRKRELSSGQKERKKKDKREKRKEGKTGCKRRGEIKVEVQIVLVLVQNMGQGMNMNGANVFIFSVCLCIINFSLDMKLGLMDINKFKHMYL